MPTRSSPRRAAIASTAASAPPVRSPAISRRCSAASPGRLWSASGGPYPRPPPGSSAVSAAAVRRGRAERHARARATGDPTNVSACLMQGDERLTHPPCAPSAPSRSGARGSRDAASPTRTQRTSRAPACGRSTPRSGGGTWTGALNGRPFVLTTRPQPGCSDGMSDRRYPLGVELTVERRGTAGMCGAAVSSSLRGTSTGLIASGRQSQSAAHLVPA